MEFIFKEENGKLFGSTKVLGIGKRKPELIYGNKAKELREKAKLTLDELSKEFDIRPTLLNKIENNQASLDEKTLNKYIDKFEVNKEYFFDLDLETLILSGDGFTLKSFKTGKECKEYYNEIMKNFNESIRENINIYIDFSKSLKEIKGKK